MIFNFRKTVTKNRPKEIISVTDINTTDWYDIEKFWEDTDIESYDAIECAHESIVEKGHYTMWCDTDFFKGDGCTVSIEIYVNK
jgi:hypothetical protein